MLFWGTGGGEGTVCESHGLVCVFVCGRACFFGEVEKGEGIVGDSHTLVGVLVCVRGRYFRGRGKLGGERDKLEGKDMLFEDEYEEEEEKEGVLFSSFFAVLQTH